MKEIRSYPVMECKTAKETPGRFTGYASTWSKDAYGDRIIPGAFTGSIKDQKGKVPILMNHDSDVPIGFTVDLAEDAKGLYFEGALALNTSAGADVYALLQLADSLDYRVGMSIGFMTQEADFEDDGSRSIKSIDLWETSVTMFPANSRARIDDVKSQSAVSARNVESLLRDVGRLSKDDAKRVLAVLRPYLLLSADVRGSGEPEAARRDVSARILTASTALIREHIKGLTDGN